MIGTPKAEAASPAVTAPLWPTAMNSSPPTGASITGRRIVLPNSVAVLSMLDTSRSTRGRRASASMPMRLRRIVVSVSVAPTR